MFENCTDCNKNSLCSLRKREQNGGDGSAGTSDQAQGSSVREARADRDAEDRTEVEQEYGRGGSDESEEQVREREEYSERDDAQTEKRTENSEGERSHLLE